MKLYIVECTTQDGFPECNGIFLQKENAQKHKDELDKEPGNIKYGIVQHIIETETQD